MNINADTVARGDATGGDTPGPMEVVRAFLGELIDRFGQSCGPTGGPKAGTTVAPDVLVALWLGEMRPVHLSLIPTRIYGGVVDNAVLVAAPMFIFMGVVMEKTRIAEDLLLTL